MKKKDVLAELSEINDLISSASLLGAIRREVNAVVRNQTMITDGKHSDQGTKYDAVISRCASEDVKVVARRLKANIPDIEVKELVDGVIGVRTARRG